MRYQIYDKFPALYDGAPDARALARWLQARRPKTLAASSRLRHNGQCIVFNKVFRFENGGPVVEVPADVSARFISCSFGDVRVDDGAHPSLLKHLRKQAALTHKLSKLTPKEIERWCRRKPKKPLRRHITWRSPAPRTYSIPAQLVASRVRCS